MFLIESQRLGVVSYTLQAEGASVYYFREIEGKKSVFYDISKESIKYCGELFIYF